MKNNFRELIKEELVNRFESVVTNEINEFQKIKSEIFNRLDSIDKGQKLFDYRLTILKNDNDTSYNDVIEKFHNEKKTLSDNFEDQRRHIRTTKQDISNHVDNSNLILDKVVLVNKFDSVTKDLEEQINDLEVYLHDQNVLIKEHIYENICDLRNEFNVDNESSKIVVNLLLNRINELNRKMEEVLVSNEGFIKELEAVKKKAFIKEKKIENIYFVLDQINKRLNNESVKPS